MSAWFARNEGILAVVCAIVIFWQGIGIIERMLRRIEVVLKEIEGNLIDANDRLKAIGRRLDAQTDSDRVLSEDQH